MNMRFKTAWQELSINPGRSLLMVLALLMGLWGLGSNAVSYLILSKDLDENFKRTLPPHVILTSTDFNKLDMPSFRNRPEIAATEFRDLSFQRIEIFPDQWIPLWLFGVEDFDHLQVARFYQQEGQRVPEPGSMLIERNGQLISDLKLNSQARVRVGTKTHTLPVRGINFDPAQAPADQDAFIYAYVDKQTYAELSDEPINQRLIVRFKGVHSRQDVERVSRQIINDFKALGIEVNNIDIPRFASHPHQFQLNTLITFQGAIGLLAFFMGAVLVSQLMQAIMARQVRQIGIMQALGARRRQVAGIYLGMVLMLGAMTTLIAFPVALVSGRSFANFVATVLNFDVLTTTLPTYAYLFLLLTGLLLPVLFTLPTILRGTGIPVVMALTDYGIDSKVTDQGKSWLERLPLSHIYRLSIRNLFRKKRRMALTLFMIALGVAIFSAGFNVRQSLIAFLEETNASQQYDIQVILKEDLTFDQASAPFSSMNNLKQIETWAGAQAYLSSDTKPQSSSLRIVALPYDSKLVKRKIYKGRWLQPAAEPEIVINQAAADILGLHAVGGPLNLQIKGQVVSVRLAGIIKEFDLPKIYMDRHQFDDEFNPQGLVKTVLLSADDRRYERVVEMKRDVERRIEKSDLAVRNVQSQTERAKIIYDHLDIILTIFGFLSLLVLIVSAFGMASTTGINVLERTREIGVMRAIGATPQKINSLFVIEGMLLNMTGIAAGIIAGLPLSEIGARFFGNLILGHGVSLEFAFNPNGLLITLLVMGVFGWLASRLPARKAIAISTRNALSYE